MPTDRSDDPILTESEINSTAENPPCDRKPEIKPSDVEDESITFFDGDDIYARSLSFSAGGRQFEILDRDLDGVADHLFSFGKGSVWCMDHEKLPKDVIGFVRKQLKITEEEIKIPDEFKWDRREKSRQFS